MNVVEALNRGFGFGVGQEQTISGSLTVCEKFSYLSATEHSDRTQSVLIADDTLSRRLLDAGVPVRIGTMVMFFGKATVSGLLTASGLAPFPIAFYRLTTLDFQDEQGPIRISFGADR